jgi:hypothetical protein
MLRKNLATMMGAGMVLLGTLTPMVASAAAPAAALPVTASVVDQKCLNGDTVQVTLMAVSATPAVYAWDFTNNGSIDTRPRAQATVMANYPDERTFTARVVAGDAAGNRGADTVTFTTMRCGGGGSGRD